MVADEMESVPQDQVLNARDGAFKKTVLFVALANLAYFGVEFIAASKSGSVSLFADSIDFLEDTSINLLILFAMSWSLQARARVGHGLALLILVPSLFTLNAIVHKFSTHSVPAPAILSLVAAGALVVNLACAARLMSFRHHSGSLAKAAFLSSRNDALANIAMIIAGFITARTNSYLPDLAVGLGIALINTDSAREVWRAAGQEKLKAVP